MPIKTFTRLKKNLPTECNSACKVVCSSPTSCFCFPLVSTTDSAHLATSSSSRVTAHPFSAPSRVAHLRGERNSGGGYDAVCRRPASRTRTAMRQRSAEERRQPTSLLGTWPWLLFPSPSLHAHPCSAHDAQLDVGTRICRFAFFFSFAFSVLLRIADPDFAGGSAGALRLPRTQSTRDGTVSAKPIARKQSVKMPTLTGAAERGGFSGFYPPVREKALGRGRTDRFHPPGFLLRPCLHAAGISVGYPPNAVWR